LNPATTISLHQVSFTWPSSQHFSLNIDAFTLQKGERVLLLGQSGSGKSTLLSLLCGILAPQQGQIQVAGQDLATLSPSKRDRLRAEHIGVIFQQFNLLPYGSVADNILLPLTFAPNRRQRVAAKGSSIAEVKRLCQALQLPDEVLSSQAGELSVGQQQRVAVARALIGEPEIIIADEPTSALDQQSQQAFMELLMGQIEATQSSLLMVSHEPSLAKYFDRVVHLENLQGDGLC
jgi:putative ABC transport system ATP-binding protein